LAVFWRACGGSIAAAGSDTAGFEFTNKRTANYTGMSYADRQQDVQVFGVQRKRGLLKPPR